MSAIGTIGGNQDEYRCLAMILTEKSAPVFIQPNASRNSYCLRNPLTDCGRAIIDLQHISHQDCPGVLKELGIDADHALSNLCHHLGNGDLALGSQHFESLKNQGLITVERVGFSKSGQAKFYIMVNQHKGYGCNNRFHIGISRRGTLRAVNRSRHHNMTILNRQLKAGTYVQNIHHILGKFSSISRVMDHELGIRVSELGHESLSKINVNLLTPEERARIYICLIKGLKSLHENGLTHNDLKPSNVVVCRNSDGKICGVKIIDLDTLAKEHAESVVEGTAEFIAPERLILANKHGKLTTYPMRQFVIASSKEDLWSAMLIICKLEAQVTSDSNRLLSQPILDRFNAFLTSFYQSPSGISIEEKTLNALCQRTQWIQEDLLAKGRDNLFADIPIATPIDFLVYSMAYIEPSRRASAPLLLSNLAYEARLGAVLLDLPNHRQRVEECKIHFLNASENLDEFYQYPQLLLEDGTPLEALQNQLQILKTERNRSLQRLSEAIGEEVRLSQAGFSYLRALPPEHPAHRCQRIFSVLCGVFTY